MRKTTRHLGLAIIGATIILAVGILGGCPGVSEPLPATSIVPGVYSGITDAFMYCENVSSGYAHTQSWSSGMSFELTPDGRVLIDGREQVVGLISGVSSGGTTTTTDVIVGETTVFVRKSTVSPPDGTGYMTTLFTRIDTDSVRVQYILSTLYDIGLICDTEASGILRR